MARLDAYIDQQFAWTASIPTESAMTDPEVSAKVLASYFSDPAYTAPSPRVEDVMIDGPLGDRSLPVRVYRPVGERPAPYVLVWSHGGAFIAGDLDAPEADVVAREICARSGAVVVSVGYHVVDGTNGYPNLHREVAAAFEWVTTDGDLHAEGGRVFVGGASAGANLTVGAVLELRDAGQELPDGLVLVYPLLHDPVPEPRVAADLSVVPSILRLPSDVTSWILANYRGDSDGRYILTEGHDLGGLPEVLVVASEYDDFRGSADTFSEEARSRGVAVEEFLAEGMPHGHLAMPPTLAGVGETLDAIVRFMLRART